MRQFNLQSTHDDKEYENKNDVLTELIKRYNIETKILNDLLLKIAIEIHERCGTSFRGNSVAFRGEQGEVEIVSLSR